MLIDNCYNYDKMYVVTHILKTKNYIYFTSTDCFTSSIYIISTIDNISKGTIFTQHFEFFQIKYLMTTNIVKITLDF